MFQSVDHFEIYEIEVFVYFTPSAFNNSDVSRGLSGVHWQQTLLLGLVCRHPIYEEPYRSLVIPPSVYEGFCSSIQIPTFFELSERHRRSL